MDSSIILAIFLVSSLLTAISAFGAGSIDGESVVVTASRNQPTIFQAFKAIALSILVLWTVVANSLVFIVLYKNPRLQTVPNLLVGNLAFSDLALGFIVLPLSSVYAIAGEWLFPETICEIFVSADILCSTASIWNLSIVGLDRYWAITSPVGYLAKRTKKTACLMILSVWLSSALISLAPLLGWKQVAEHPNLVEINGTWQCTFLDLPSYTIYSATGSFFIPTLLMFFVYFKIYQAFAKHRARQIYRQKVIRKHIESTILHEISHVLPTSDEFAKDEEEEDESDSSEKEQKPAVIPEEDDEGGDSFENEQVMNDSATQETNVVAHARNASMQQVCPDTVVIRRESLCLSLSTPTANNCVTKVNPNSLCRKNSVGSKPGLHKSSTERNVAFHGTKTMSNKGDNMYTKKYSNSKGEPIGFISYEKIKRHKQRKERMYRKSLQRKPRAISAAKERRGVKVLGIILGCFTICWTPFFLMYVIVQFTTCNINPHVEMFITWLGYSNSAMNPIIYTVFNRDYQIALKRLFTNSEKQPLTIRLNI
ncbi:7 transmembrane receptor (rhodopsin family) domain-containing protein [Ditylenchus destructor]|uniref:7 transmembrane receptor (Rhodopsin family) domain-containing protein n=1 Tax=Ditylenchus destructor TaxID=166010 RepID=A0AAD4R3E2_9BILA|nr:7 transmembrane receptor (rhodopsin family) domain-containing protein [Ditylenchus destructor]